MNKLVQNNAFLFLLNISKQDQEVSSCSRSGLSLPGRGHVLVRCSHTITGLRTLFLFLLILDMLWNSLVPFTLYCEVGVFLPLSELGLIFLTNPQGRVEKLSPQEVPEMLTMSFKAANPLRTV